MANRGLFVEQTAETVAFLCDLRVQLRARAPYVLYLVNWMTLFTRADVMIGGIAVYGHQSNHLFQPLLVRVQPVTLGIGYIF